MADWTGDFNFLAAAVRLFDHCKIIIKSKMVTVIKMNNELQKTLALMVLPKRCKSLVAHALNVAHRPLPPEGGCS